MAKLGTRAGAREVKRLRLHIDDGYIEYSVRSDNVLLRKVASLNSIGHIEGGRWSRVGKFDADKLAELVAGILARGFREVKGRA